MKTSLFLLAFLCYFGIAHAGLAENLDRKNSSFVCKSYQQSQASLLMDYSHATKSILSAGSKRTDTFKASNPSDLSPFVPCKIPFLKGRTDEAKSGEEQSPVKESGQDSEKKQESERWSSFLPLMADEVEKRGIELPLPFGVSGNLVIMKREIDIKEVKAGINGPPRDVSSFLTLDTDTTATSAALRFDTWLLPFLNLYVLGGYIENSPNITLTLRLPTLLPPGGFREVTLNATGRLDGIVLGGGATLVGGYKDFFLSLDANINHADMGGNFDQTIDVRLYSVRTGWRGQVGKAMMNLWVGGMYWDSERKISGSLPLEGGDVLNFEVLQAPKNPFNMDLGMNVEVSRAFQMVVDYGFNLDDFQMLTLSFAYRF
jgi:hypothetical protein